MERIPFFSFLSYKNIKGWRLVSLTMFKIVLDGFSTSILRYFFNQVKNACKMKKPILEIVFTLKQLRGANILKDETRLKAFCLQLWILKYL